MTELESDFGKEVKQGAVVMALKRLTEELDFRLNHKINKVIKTLVKSQLFCFDGLYLCCIRYYQKQTSRLNYRY
jgi:hypothetical protein